MSKIDHQPIDRRDIMVSVIEGLKDTMNESESPYGEKGAEFHLNLYRQMKTGKSVEGIQTRERVETVLALAGNVKGKSVLDIGTGIGLFAISFATNGAKVTAMDSSPNMLKVAREIVARESQVEVIFVHCAAPELPFPDSSFDFVVMGDIMEHLPQSVLSETCLAVHRVLKEGGKLVVHTAPTKYNAFFVSNVPFRYLGLPVLCLALPDSMIEQWLEFLLRFRLWYKRTISRNLATGEVSADKYGHINCQTRGSVYRQLVAAGLQVEQVFTKEIFLSNKEQFLRLPFRAVPSGKRHFLHRSVFALARRQ
jgi:ubiquinone/menaquinone biosynthesis C-methylase UbiE